MYKFLKDKYGKLWISNNGSTIVSQLADTIIFTLIAFAGVIPVINMVEMAVTTLIFKVIIALLDTPFLYYVSKYKKKKKEEF